MIEMACVKYLNASEASNAGSAGSAGPEEPVPFNACDFCMDWEDGLLSDDEIAAGFQHLIYSGLAWRLQGAYGRMANRLIQAGRCQA